VGDGTYDLTGAGTADARLLLSVPQGSDHDAWTGGNRSIRVLQPAQDENLSIEVKFETSPTQRFQTQGVLIEQDANNFLRVDFSSDGNRLFLFAARLTEGVATTFISEPIVPGNMLYLRVFRDGDIWTPRYSYDGVSWQSVPSFTSVLAVSRVGVFAGNAGPNPAFTAAIDYFFNASSPVLPEDGPGCLEGEQFDVAVGVIGNGTVSLSPMTASYECGDQVTLTANAGLGSAFIRWIGTSSGADNPVTLTVNADVTMTAEFAADLIDLQLQHQRVVDEPRSLWHHDESRNRRGR
jgi:hypothetical protein